MKNPSPLVLLLSAALLHYSPATLADVDDADSLDFESFHQQDSTVKTWKSKPKEGKETDQKSAQSMAERGNTFEIREPYTTESSSITSAISNAYLQMGRYCPRGWKKLAEWSEQESSMNYLYFEFSCKN